MKNNGVMQNRKINHPKNLEATAPKNKRFKSFISTAEAACNHPMKIVSLLSIPPSTTVPAAAAEQQNDDYDDEKRGHIHVLLL